MNDIYYTIKGPGSSQYKEKMSRFLSFAIPVKSQDEAKAEIKRYQNEYHDSRHVCWAYMIGSARTEWQLNDNGEPSGTAGKPILGQINSFNVTDVVVIVVRYFGGIKLGTSGLIAAYREAARLALEDAGVKEMRKKTRLSIDFPYISQEGVMRVAKGEDVETVSREFDNLCHILIEFPESKKEEIIGKLSKVEGAVVEEVSEG
ncbi:MAG: IMPACT family protein [Muribaculaceae bacterium]|nr:IMPACT family protein [Muribaculaceae bacterium]MDE6026721.1 IMPACT family protein [Muribaculaceae bacterium]